MAGGAGQSNGTAADRLLAVARFGEYGTDRTHDRTKIKLPARRSQRVTYISSEEAAAAALPLAHKAEMPSRRSLQLSPWLHAALPCGRSGPHSVFRNAAKRMTPSGQGPCPLSLLMWPENPASINSAPSARAKSSLSAKEE